MKKFATLYALLMFAAFSTGLAPQRVQAESRVYVGVDLGGIVAAFDNGPRYVYAPPVVYERWHAWTPPPPRYHRYPPHRYHRYPPPPPRPHYDHHRHREYWDHEPRGYHRR